jgi:hypothetical protein
MGKPQEASQRRAAATSATIIRMVPVREPVTITSGTRNSTDPAQAATISARRWLRASALRPT